jgi:hypothetical protein
MCYGIGRGVGGEERYLHCVGGTRTSGASGDQEAELHMNGVFCGFLGDVYGRFGVLVMGSGRKDIPRAGVLEASPWEMKTRNNLVNVRRACICIWEQ